MIRNGLTRKWLKSNFRCFCSSSTEDDTDSFIERMKESFDDQDIPSREGEVTKFKLAKWIQEDESWPKLTGNEEFEEYWKFADEDEDDLSDEQIQEITKEAVYRMQVKPFKSLKLPKMKVMLDPENENYKALSLIKLGLSKVPHYTVQEKDELMRNMVDEVEGAMLDKTLDDTLYNPADEDIRYYKFPPKDLDQEEEKQDDFDGYDDFLNRK